MIFAFHSRAPEKVMQDLSRCLNNVRTPLINPMATIVILILAELDLIASASIL
jgi:hypothetical protein